MKHSLQIFAAAAGLGLFALPAQALPSYKATLSGANEVPAVITGASGFSSVKVDGDLLTVHFVWSNLEGGLPSAAHIHCCAVPGTNAPVAVGFPGIPIALSGTFDGTFNMTNIAIYGGTFLSTFGGGTAAGAEAALLAGLAAGNAYTNIHNPSHPGGEIRGLLKVARVPEPGTLVLFTSGLLGLVLARRKRRSV